MKRLILALSFIFLFIPLGLRAAVVPLQERVLFSNTDNHQRLLVVNNDSDAPVLLQSWIDDGSSGDLNKEKNYPFVVIPAVVRMSPGKIINLKILPTKQQRDLPTDRESVFWVNLYEIPGVKKSQREREQNKIEVGLNTQLKVIYRPFKGAMDINNTGKAISIRLIDNGQSLELDNPTPYYVTPVSVTVKSSSAEQSVKLGMSRLIAPFGHKRFRLPEVMNSRNLTVDYTLVDDSGKETRFTKTLN